LLDIGPLLEAAEKVIAFVKRLRALGLPVQDLDLGGGLGVPYRSTERAPSVADLIAPLSPKLAKLGVTLFVEPGRSIVAEAGILLTRVLLVKQNGRKTFVVVDAGMNDLIRPALYQAHHEIVPVVCDPTAPEIEADIVGPVCETGDFFARSRHIPAVKAGDLLAIRTTGAYGFALSSNYNSRPRACELLVDGASITVARRRETWEDLIENEQ
jgi:diaminopimelate decarboxylase